MQLSTSRLAEMLSAIRASPLALHLARAPMRGSAGRLRPVCTVLLGHPEAPVHARAAEPAEHDPSLAIGALYESHVKMRALREALATLRSDFPA